jgi:predicted nucleic acid-binding protein
MIVADTNLICYLYFETPHSELATRVHEKDPEWAAPLLWRSEFNQVLATYLRKRLLSFSDALEVADYAQRTIGSREFSVTHPRVLDLVNQSTCSAYDCEFVALATDLQVSLLTFDQQVLREFPQIAVHPEEFVKAAV